MSKIAKVVGRAMATGAVAGVVTATVITVAIIGFVIYVRFTGVSGTKGD